MKKSADKSLLQPWCSHSNIIYEIQLQKTIVLRMQQRHQATLTQPLQCDLQRLSCKTQKNYAQRRWQLQLQDRISTPKRRKDDFKALFKRTFQRQFWAPKNEKICWQITVAALMQQLQYYLREPAATFMQPLQCVSQHHVANPHLSTHMATEHDNNHAAIPMRCATRDSRNAQNYTRRNNHSLKNTEEETGGEKHKVSCSGFLLKTSPMQHSCSHYNASRSITLLTRISLRTWQQSMTTIMQPSFQCDAQPEIQDTHRTTHTGTTTRCRTQRRNRFAHETTAAAPAAHRRYLSSLAAATLHGRAQGFVLRLPPQNQPHATFMQPLQCVSQHHVANPHLSTHMATEHDNNHAAIPMRCATRDSRNAQNYTHRNNHSLQNTEEEPIRAWNDRSRTRRTQEVPFIAGCSHFTWKKHKVSCSGFLPKTSPMQHSCSHYTAFRSITWLTRISLRTWQQSMTTIMQPSQCDPQPEIQDTHRTTHTGTTTRCKTQRRNRFAHETTAAAPAAHTRYLSLPSLIIF